MDIFTPAKRSEVMSLIKGKNTSIEKEVFRELRRNKIHFQRHYKRVPGKPDVAVPSRKLAVFVDGDFWHGWKYDSWKKRLASDFWRKKIETNMRRDKRNFALLRRRGWKVMRIWEHELIPRRKEKTFKKLVNFLAQESRG